MRKAVGAILITPNGELIFQHRDNKPGISYPDKISLFGGGAEEGEDELTTLYRELYEETELVKESLGEPERLLEFIEPKESNGLGDVHVTIYLFRNVDPNRLIVHEGQGLKVVPIGAGPKDYNFTPLALAVLEAVRKLETQTV